MVSESEMLLSLQPVERKLRHRNLCRPEVGTRFLRKSNCFDRPQVIDMKPETVDHVVPCRFVRCFRQHHVFHTARTEQFRGASLNDSLRHFTVGQTTQVHDVPVASVGEQSDVKTSDLLILRTRSRTV